MGKGLEVSPRSRPSTLTDTSKFRVETHWNPFMERRVAESKRQTFYFPTPDPKDRCNIRPLRSRG